MTPRSIVAPLCAALLLPNAVARATPAEDLNRAFLELQRGYYPAARADAAAYIAANGPQFTAAFIVAMAQCMIHPHRTGNGAAFRQLRVDYIVSGPKNRDIDRAISDCTSPPPPPPPPPEAGVSVSGLTARPDFSGARPSNDVPPPRRPRPAPVVAPRPTVVLATPVLAIPVVPAPVIAATPALVPRPPSPDRCRDPFVWRHAFAGDHVCVAMQVRLDAADDNAHAAERRDPNGPYGPLTCIQGYVWRGARDGDAVCVVPERRDQAAADNAQAAARRVG